MLRYDLPEYIAMAKMSSKVRILVEGKDDRNFILGLVKRLTPTTKLSIDTAVDIGGNCKNTAANNRAKIEKIHEHCKTKGTHPRLFFLCDREFRKFEIEKSVLDLINGHETDSNLVWTEGHSLENYFLSPNMLLDGFKYLCGSGNKTKSMELLEKIFPDAIIQIAALTLAAKELQCASYPAKIVRWDNISIENGKLNLGLHLTPTKDLFLETYISAFERFQPVARNTPLSICTRLCRGHTAVIALQRIFSACIYFSSKSEDDELARYDANLFNNIAEANIATALSEAWISGAVAGTASYPAPLIDSITNVA